MLRFALDGTKYEFDQDRLLNTEAIVLQKVTGLKMKEFGEALQEGDAEAVTALVWLAKRRAGEDVKFSELEFDLGELMSTMQDDSSENEQGVEPVEPDPTGPPPESTSSGAPAT